MTEQPAKYLIVESYTLRQGWIELDGVTPIHHAFVVVQRTAEGNYIVINPAFKLAAGRGDDGPR